MCLLNLSKYFNKKICKPIIELIYYVIVSMFHNMQQKKMDTKDYKITKSKYVEQRCLNGYDLRMY